jgi:hypothetical protein
MNERFVADWRLWLWIERALKDSGADQPPSVGEARRVDLRAVP